MAWPDAVALTIAYLTPIAAPAQVASRAPEQAAPRDPLVQVRRVGGSTLLVRDVARLDVFAWAPTEAEAWPLALTVRSAMWALNGTTLLGPTCYRVEEFLSPRQFDDPASGTPRVWATYELALRADEAIRPAS
ncbi:hypothetical protein [Streptomyces sp. bgisy153]|uniref:hypothetical protein n=1 Tax=Streptomyces sp. bgisy153 TaxID=3413793 RepID=UPI003D739F30